MLRVCGSLLILSGGGMIYFMQRRERRRRREVLWDLRRTLERVGEEIRMARTPLPGLLESLAGDCGPEVSALLVDAASAAAKGEDLAEVWRRGVESLPLDGRIMAVLAELNLRGDEENIRKGISLVTRCLTERYELLERQRGEEDKRAAALCLSGAALLVILLI